MEDSVNYLWSAKGIQLLSFVLSDAHN